MGGTWVGQRAGSSEVLLTVLVHSLARLPAPATEAEAGGKVLLEAEDEAHSAIVKLHVAGT